MAVTTAAVVAAGATVAGAAMSAQGAKKSAQAFDGVEYNPNTAAKRVNKYMPVAFGGGTAFKDMQEATNEIVLGNLRGQVSQQTQTMLGRQMLGTGATDMGPGAVNQLYTGYLGLTQEDQQTKGVDQYRSLYAQYQQAVDKQASNQYASDLNKATARASGIAGKYDAYASGFAGIASIAGAYAGGGMGGGGGGSGWGMGGGGSSGGIGYQNMTMAGGNQFSGPSTIPSGYVPRNVSDRPPGLL